jgi:hypothetical protein
MNLTYEIFAPPVPEFVAPALENLYESVYCTILRFETYGLSRTWFSFLIFDDGVLVGIIVFQHRGHAIDILNQQIELDAPHLRFFVRTMFSLFPQSVAIKIRAITTKIDRADLFFDRYFCVNENIVSLASTADEFVAGFSPSFRSGLRSRHRKLLADFPEFCYEFHDARSFSVDDVDSIVKLSESRMSMKGRNSYIDSASREKILTLLRGYGLVGVARIGGEICGGTLCYFVGRRYFFHVISHDPKYDRYGLGNVLNYLTFLYCIERGVKECWMMGGNDQHKAQFRALPVELYGYTFYRSTNFFCFLLYDRLIRFSMVFMKKSFV